MKSAIGLTPEEILKIDVTSVRLLIVNAILSRSGLTHTQIHAYHFIRPLPV